MADEEVDGRNGIRYLMENHFHDLNAGLVLSEGGYGTRDLVPDRPVYMISTAEKGHCWIELESKGMPGHGSMPHDQNGLEKLVRGINKILDRDNPFIITDVVGKYFKDLGSRWDLFCPYLEDGTHESLVQCLEQGGMAEKPEIAALVKNTISVNFMEAGGETNTIPSMAKARLDIRLLPGHDPDDFVEGLMATLNDHDITVKIISKSDANESTTESEDFLTIKRVLEDSFPDAVIAPSLEFGSTDIEFFRQKGISAYGVFPCLLNENDINMIHGDNEKISIGNLIQGTRIYIDLVKELCVN